MPEAGGTVAEGQHRLFPAAERQQAIGVQHQQVARDEADLLAEGRERADQRIDTEMGVLAQRDDGAEERQPDQPASATALPRSECPS
jgi:hypothetical protein